MAEHCEACKQEKAAKTNRYALRNWVRTERVKIHRKYQLALLVFDEVYARPRKYTLESAQQKLADSQKEGA